MKEEKKHSLAEVKQIMQEICDKNKIKLSFLKPDEGEGGYNYGCSAGDEIWLAPFRKCKAGDKVGKYTIERDCTNPVECMFIAFFHELSHCRLADTVPNILSGYAWTDTSKFQYELWITMRGIQYAYTKHGIKFSDQSVRWLLNENMTYIYDDWKDFGDGLVEKKPTSRQYSTVGLSKDTFPIVKSRRKHG